MTSEQFTYWLQGFSETNISGEPPSKIQWQIIQDHLKQVFKKETPDRVTQDPFHNPFPLTNPPNDFPYGPTVIC